MHGSGTLALIVTTTASCLHPPAHLLLSPPASPPLFTHVSSRALQQKIEKIEDQLKTDPDVVLEKEQVTQLAKKHDITALAGEFETLKTQFTKFDDEDRLAQVLLSTAQYILCSVAGSPCSGYYLSEAGGA